MHFLKILCLFPLGCLLLLTGCATSHVRTEPQAISIDSHQVEMDALVQELVKLPLQEVRAIEGTWGQKKFQAQSVVKGDGKTLKIIFLAPHMRLVTLTLTAPHTLQATCAPLIPKSFVPEYMLFDFAFIHLPAPVLKSILEPTFKIEETATMRLLLLPNGEEIATLERHEKETLVFRNLLHNYSYTLAPISATQEPFATNE